MDERRRSPRTDASGPLIGGVRVTSLDQWIPAEIVNLSDGGVMVAVERPVCSSPTSVELKMDLNGEHFESCCDIVWSRGRIDSEPYGHGVRFGSVNSRYRAALQRYLLLDEHYVSGRVAAEIGQANGCTDETLDHVRKFFVNEVRRYANDLDTFSRRLDSRIPQSHYDVFKVDDLSKRIVTLGDSLEKDVNHQAVIRKVKDLFRRVVGNWVFQSDIMRHAFEKPRGYPGDHQLLEKIYNAQPISRGLGFCFDRCFLENPYAIAVRNRKNWMKHYLKTLWSMDGTSPLRILNLACGSCREIREALAEDVCRREVAFDGVDFDNEALAFSQRSLEAAPASFHARYTQVDMLGLTRDERYKGTWRNMDLVYSIGLADYLPDRVLKKIISFSHDLVKSGGVFILAHKDRDAYRPVLHDWFCDWTFFRRSRDDLVRLFVEVGIRPDTIRVEEEASKHIFFVIAKGK